MKTAPEISYVIPETNTAQPNPFRSRALRASNLVELRELEG